MAGTARFARGRQTARISASWKVVRLWELRAEDLLAAGDVGLVPWVPLTHSDDPPEVVLVKCRERINQEADPSNRAGLLAVTQLLAALAFPNRSLLSLLGGPQVMIESPLLDEVRELIRVQAETQYLAQYLAQGLAQGQIQGRLQTQRSDVIDALTVRFGQVPLDRLAGLDQVTDEASLKALHRLAITCRTLEEFLAGLNGPGQ
jgi:hypothetical protein